MCGQTCLAMLLEISLFEAVVAIGHTSGTRTKEIIEVLRRYGWRCGSKLKRIKASDKSVPEICLMKMLFRKTNGKVKNSHWLVHYHGRLFDPERPVGSFCNGDVSSYLELKPPDKITVAEN